MSAEERREAHLYAMKWSHADLTTRSAGWAYDSLLAHFDEFESAVANAIRYGLADATEVYNRWELDTAIASGEALYVIQPNDEASRDS